MFSIVKVKDEITNTLINIIKNLYNFELSFDEVYSMLEIPSKKEFGNLSFPVFSLAKKLKKSPVNIVEEIKKEFELIIDKKRINNKRISNNKKINDIQKNNNNKKMKNKNKKIDNNNFYDSNNSKNLYIINNLSCISGFLNFKFDLKIVLLKLIEDFAINNTFYITQYYKRFKMVMDYSAPNIAKPFGIGHLISTTLGESIKKMYKMLGSEVIGINYIGDWGTQFGKVITAFLLWGDYKKLEKEGVYYLYRLYVKFHEEEEKEPSILEKAKENFKKLENFDPEIYNLWEKFREISLKEFNELYKKLNIEIDLTEGESKYNKEKISEVVEIIKINGILEESEGAKVVFLDDIYKEKIPPCIIETKDGTSIYAIRDIAALLDRWERFKFDRIIYVTGITQSLHFKQVFGVIRKLNFPFKDRLFHIPFGTMRFQGEKMATRKGKLIFLKDVYEKVYNEALSITKEKNISQNPVETAEKLTAGALTFSILKNSRIKDIDFDFSNVLSFEGDTSVYLQYTITRINSIIDKIGDIKISEEKIKNLTEVSFFEVFKEKYKDIYLDLFSFEQVLLESTKNYEPYIIARYSLKLAKSFNSFYTNEKVLVDDEDERFLKIILILIIKDILEKSLEVLNIPVPEKL